jgi:hypothetical protein
MEKSFSLVSSNLDIMKDKIPMERLSLVFQHALLATLTFGYNFIWIDSLCIIQDSIEDWNTESAHMGSIYKNSVCTLAATGFPDGSYGLFAGRDPALVLPFQVNVDLRHWKRTTDHDIAELRGIFPDSWNKEIENSPLYQRAWVVQERVLSPRILHFTKSQIYWECCESRCSEVYPQGVFKKHVFGSMSGGQHVDFNCKTYSLLTGHPKYEHLEERHREAFHLGFMNAIIKAHSWSKLTFPSDKLVSLAGIANELQSVFDDTYIAGMFYKHLPHSLLWTVHYPTIRRSEYGAPTWSWASVDGPINPWRGVKFDDVQLGSRPPTLVYLTGIETHPTTKNPCGPLNAARLSIQGELFQLTASGQALLASIEPPQLSSPPNFVKIDDNISISVTPDMKEFYTMAKEDTYCARE